MLRKIASRAASRKVDKPLPDSDQSILQELESMRTTHNLYNRAAYFIAGIILIVGVIWGGNLLYHRLSTHSQLSSDPVPLTIRQDVGFSVYYPNPSKLPDGYTLDVHSFTNGNQVVEYTVSSPNNQKLVFSVQPKPSDTEIQSFHKKNLPLHTTVTTPVGAAIVGAISHQAVASLPTSGDAWVIITAPANIDQGELSQVLQAIQKAP